MSSLEIPFIEIMEKATKKYLAEKLKEILDELEAYNEIKYVDNDNEDEIYEEISQEEFINKRVNLLNIFKKH